MNAELPAEMQAMSTNPAKVRHHADPLHDYRSEHVKLQEKLAEMWGAEEPYTPVVEETGSFFQRYYYSWVYKTVLLASKEKLKKHVLPPPTRDCRAHECGKRISRSIQKAMYARNAWNCMVGTAVVSTLDPASRGVLRWVGVPQQGGYTRMMAGVEWSVPPAVRTAARGDDSAVSPFFDGVVHGEHLFTPEHSDMSTLEEVTQVNLDFYCRGGVVAIPTPHNVPLVRILATDLSYYLLMQNPFLFISNVCTIAMPLMLKKFVLYLSAEEHTWRAGLGLVVAIFVLQAVQSVCVHRYNFLSIKGGAQLRAALSTVVFEKCLIISSKSLAQPEMNAGRIINMVSTDVERSYFFMQFCMAFWSSPMMLVLALLQLYELVGWCTIVAVVAFLAVLPLNGRLVMQMRNARRNLSKATDIRVKGANEFFSGIRIAKFMTWEPRFIANIEAKRETEIFFLKRIQYTRVATTFLNSATPMVMVALVFTLYYATGNELTATVVFPTIALLGILKQPFQQIPFVFTMMVQFFIAMGRISKFLECDNAACSTVQDIEDYFKEQHEHTTACQLAAVLENVDVTAYVPVKLPFAPKIKTPLIPRMLRMMCCGKCKPTRRHPAPADVVEGEARIGSPAGSPGGGEEGRGAPNMNAEEYFELENKVLLRDVSVAVPKGKLTLVLGATGSGKSTLLQSLLSQFELTQGRIWTEKSIAYVPQQPWIMNATVRGNILFFDEEEESRLGEAIRVSQLQTDLQLLGSGLETEIGEKGVNLSGGQKARVSLARAVYANREVYLLDDPLSALDAHVGERVVDDCFLGALAGKTRVLASHQMHVVPKADYVIALGHGSVEFSGSSADFMRSPIFASMEAEPKAETKVALREARESKVATTMPGASVSGCTPTLETPTAEKESCSHEAAVADDNGENGDGAAKEATGRLTTREEKARGSVPWSTYMAYFRFCGGGHVALAVVGIFFVTELLSVSSSLWLSLWSTDHFGWATPNYLIVYLVLVVVGSASTPLRLSFTFTAMRRGCIGMHRKLLRTVATGTTEFFDRTPMGRLMSRFSRDIDMIDNGVQMTLQNTLECFFSIASSMLITVFSQPLVILVLLPAGFFYYRLMIFYNAANRETRRYTSVMKTPVFTLLTELIAGVETITAFDKSAVVMQEALKRLDVVSSCAVLENALRQWVAVRIEFLSNVIVTSIAFAGVLACMTRFGSSNVGLVSLSLTMAMQTTGQLNWLVRMAAAAEADMNSVERIQYYIQHTPTEAMPTLDKETDALEKHSGVEAGATDTVVIESVSPTAAAPHVVRAGALTLDHVQMRYREGLPLVLRDVSFSIAPREKVGVVGRTGSGKSTLLLTFMRMVDICGGEIRVDGRALGSYGLRELRRHFSMIPQDPVLFDGTVRLNVDPFLEASSAEVWHALELVGLRERVASETEGIDGRVLEGGSNFSVGQRQLMCMARALLKKGSGFILMDEATANIDPALDRQIQTTVMSAFAEYTVITIAHRLHTVAQYDKIIVMDHGVVAEMGSPRELVMDRQSVFRGMVEAMGTDGVSGFISLVGGVVAT
ncbi:putative mitochondrial ATP-binding cassette protein subfamily C, member 1, putative (ABCC1) [Leptomonas pyrrhocoris]|uniref:Putative mitochondrial ATP-binding cassette protein subfamily C, member 1, putative (ABCC1) n=1 Tax=Leptomonas pyrrhocoris TaxID=157538 RepID=A0A0M9G7R2_LEPPY|nr:putative mitochondrial ATP-binding cassette protein subfamily C, member 1, putative (ABCC1) [Leptomonas pyrrhocoris]XP_015662565.1 putative mitochondrial ATP-binding cassette protein subfamily C, member 1, putative (ABCC1) [Leptomonas pyrrhocoris]KPA84125.1 putative mitochondrial ATP-binding cassette protein subfamily C, member 1, putative (ABCC1) [Leptomonas pyrrhocoris]KPA84126.1 putative mitochondrial ATP-binding cassette protein subfamily C, member 1, putative (ABCC1) [Leptomonas pyrrhoco|eukprot:XP_015662564.1 putative mitochondrial ATP-binding cassette protein subfamily C, member 1, putative (ABCC1) [Leptomonas pyrrhocoris]